MNPSVFSPQYDYLLQKEQVYTLNPIIIVTEFQTLALHESVILLNKTLDLFLCQNFQYNNPGSTGITAIVKLKMQDKSLLHRQDVPQQKSEKKTKQESFATGTERTCLNCSFGLRMDKSKAEKLYSCLRKLIEKSFVNSLGTDVRYPFAILAISKNQKEMEHQPMFS